MYTFHKATRKDNQAHTQNIKCMSLSKDRLQCNDNPFSNEFCME
ncbi:rCG62029 [Rattus norvegicus]|uniref:RCG62029 n=1 Tax=Rattus norvegicus TaxID=10116 RepID=A6HAP9_RAT|nr:rCG62029 [Rattus norvegicus]